jgi:glycyl-tRNA synthetase beta chain
LKDAKPEAVDAERFVHDAEKKLHAMTREVSGRVGRAIEKRDFSSAIATIAELRPVVDQFFVDVMVMDDDPAIRKNRIALVADAHRVFAPLADFTKLSA